MSLGMSRVQFDGLLEEFDALAGSYYIEYLTDDIEKRVWEYLDKIDSMGGAVKCIEQGYQQEEIGRSAYEYTKAIETDDKIIVGVNKFTQEENLDNINLLRMDEVLQKRQIEKFKELKKTRDNEKVKSMLAKLKEAAMQDVNIMPLILDCVEVYCSVGEISNSLRAVWGEYRK